MHVTREIGMGILGFHVMSSWRITSNVTVCLLPCFVLWENSVLSLVLSNWVGRDTGMTKTFPSSMITWIRLHSPLPPLSQLPAPPPHHHYCDQAPGWLFVCVFDWLIDWLKRLRCPKIALIFVNCTLNSTQEFIWCNVFDNALLVQWTLLERPPTMQ